MLRFGLFIINCMFLCTFTVALPESKTSVNEDECLQEKIYY